VVYIEFSPILYITVLGFLTVKKFIWGFQFVNPPRNMPMILLCYIWPLMTLQPDMPTPRNVYDYRYIQRSVDREKC